MIPSPTLLRIATYGLLLAALPVLIHPWTWILLASAWALVGLFVLADAWSLRKAMPRAELAIPTTVGVGDPVAAAVTLTSTAKRTVQLTLRAETRGSLDPGPDLRLETRPGRTSTALELSAPVRGEGSVEALWMRASGSYGLVQRIVRVPAHAAARVVPSLSAIRRLALQPRVEGSRAGAAVTQRRGQGTEFDELQVYATGMDTRAIDWKASARHRELRVRRFRLEQNQRVMVVLDTGRGMLEQIGELQRLDHAIHTGLALADVALRNGDQVGLHAYGVRPRAWVPPGAGHRHLRKLTRATAELFGDERESNPVHGIRDLMSRLTRRSLVVVISDLREPTSTELITEALGSLARGHLVVFVALEDPLSADPLAETPKDMTTVARSLVLDDLAMERRRALQRMRGRGAEVISAPPGMAAVLLLRRYLALKRRLG